ncbi:MAG: preprotein translocase subunit YajC [Myxococcota bacterium]|nr:preprotein translocase subunit YajC [Myxococcota bacterium]
MNNQEIFRFAQAAAPEVGLMDALFQMLPFVLLIFAIFYFIYQRPMQKEQEAHQTMLKGIIVGDKVLTIGGIQGEVESIDDKTLTVKTGKKSSITVLKTSIKSKVQEES